MSSMLEQLPDDLIRLVHMFTDYDASSEVELPMRGCIGDDIQETIRPFTDIPPSGMCLVSKSFHALLPAVPKWIPSLVFLDKMFATYTQQQDDFKEQIDFERKLSAYSDTATETEKEMNPLLLDMLFSGCNLPFVICTKGKYTDEVDCHVRRLVREFPALLECTYGRLRCRYEVSPLYAACVNENVPIETIEYILKNMQTHYPHMKHRIIVNNSRRRDMMDDIERYSPAECPRTEALREMYDKYVKRKASVHVSS